MERMDKQTFMHKAALMQPRYMPSVAVKRQLAQVDMIGTVGATGVGKTSIMEHSRIPYVASDVTRQPRSGEVNGVDYNFRSDYEELMKELENGEFVQYVIFSNGEFYGTRASSYPASGPCTMAIIAETVPFFFSLGFRKMLPVYIIPPNYEEWMKRMDMHHDSDVPARMTEAKISIETALADSRFHFLVNDDLLSAAAMFRMIAEGASVEPLEQSTARQIALNLLSRIESSKPVGLEDYL
ncbi:hypothetical protein BH10PAT3_BH10PAT3_1380 [soil metagenome]